MSYKTELHCHTKEASACGKELPEYVVERYLDAGYTSLVLTNHINAATFTSKRYAEYLEERGVADCWSTKIDFYVRDYDRMLEASKGRLNVILGLELRLVCDSFNDYLIYGVTEEWLRNSECFMSIKIEELSDYVRKSGLLIYQAHPFRNGMTVVDPTLLDGYEVYNGNIGHDSRNPIAEAWAKRYNKLGISGSDFHRAVHQTNSGIITDSPITSNEELLNVLRSQNYQIIKASEK